VVALQQHAAEVTVFVKESFAAMHAAMKKRDYWLSTRRRMAAIIVAWPKPSCALGSWQRVLA
jgi:hypothetical protein